MIGALIACDHAEARNPRLLGSMRPVPAGTIPVPGRRGPLPTLSRNLHGHLAEPASEQSGECALSLSLSGDGSQAAPPSKGPDQ